MSPKKTPPRHKPMKTAEFNEALEALDLNQVTAARHLGVVLRTVHTYANGGPIPYPVAVLLRTSIAHKIAPEEWG